MEAGEDVNNYRKNFIDIPELNYRPSNNERKRHQDDDETEGPPDQTPVEFNCEGIFKICGNSITKWDSVKLNLN